MGSSSKTVGFISVFSDNRIHKNFLKERYFIKCLVSLLVQSSIWVQLHKAVKPENER